MAVPPRFAAFTTPELALIVAALEILSPEHRTAAALADDIEVEARIELSLRDDRDDAEPWLTEGDCNYATDDEVRMCAHADCFKDATLGTHWCVDHTPEFA